MAHGYTKLFEAITDSTIWAAPDTTRLVWITMLAMSDQHGYVGASVPGLASRARVSLEACIVALDSFQSPDKWSRTPDFEGRRISIADGGWILLNHAKYRAERSADDRKEYMRVYMQNKRALANVSNVNTGKPRLANTEAEAKADTNTSKSKDMSAPSAQTTKKGTSLPEDWVLPKVWGDWAVAEKPQWSVADIRRVADDFKDHWLANANQAKSKKADWLATWRKWVRSPLNEIKKPGFTGVQDARLEVMNQIWGKSNGTSRQIVDINEAGSIEGNGADIQENVPFLR